MTAHGVVTWLARMLALIGGAVLVALTIITVVSVAGRAFVWAGLRPIPGDFELVEAGAGFAVFSFLPWCQLNRAHASVDVFTSYFPDRVNRVIDLIAEILMTIAITLIAWRLWYGMMDKVRYNETTFILQFPVWWPFAACMVAAVVAVIVSFYMLTVRVREVSHGSAELESGPGGLH